MSYHDHLSKDRSRWLPGVVRAACPVVLLVALLGGCAKEEQAETPADAQAELPEPAVPDIANLEPAVKEQVEATRAELAEAPENPDITGRLAMLYQLYHLDDAADVMYRRAAALNPRAYEWHYLRGRLLLNQGKLEEAAKAFRAAAEINAMSEAVLVALAVTLQDNGDIQGARKAFEQALKVNPDLPIARYRLGKLDIEAGKLDDALTHLKRVAIKAPRVGVVHGALAELYEKKGDAARATRERILACSPYGLPIAADPAVASYQRLAKGTEYEIIRAQAAAASRNFTAALTLVDRVLEVAPETEEAYDLKARILLSQSKTDEAIELLRNAQTTLPDNPHLLCGLAVVLMANGETDEVEPLVNRALEIDPKFTPAHVILADLYQLQENVEGELEHRKAAAQIDPTRVDIRHKIAQRLLEQGNTEEAIAEWRSILEDNPAFAIGHMSLGYQLQRRGEADKAVEHYECATAADPAYVPAYLTLAQYYSGQGQHGQADKFSQEVLRNAPNSTDAMNNLAWLRATCPDSLYRNGAQAVRLATEICKRTQFQHPGYVDTLAAACAEVGDFANAVKYQQQTIDLVVAAGQTPAPTWHERLRLYRSGKPYREMPVTTQPAQEPR